VPGDRSWRLELPPRRHLELDGKGLPTGRSTREPAERDATAPTNALVTGDCPLVRAGERFTASFTVTAS